MRWQITFLTNYAIGQQSGLTEISTTTTTTTILVNISTNNASNVLNELVTLKYNTFHQLKLSQRMLCYFLAPRSVVSRNLYD